MSFTKHTTEGKEGGLGNQLNLIKNNSKLKIKRNNYTTQQLKTSKQ